MKNAPLILGLAGLISATALLSTPPAFAVEYHHGEEAVNKKLGEKQFSPYAGRAYPTRVLWGD